MKKLLKRISDIPNALRLLDIMDAAGGVDIERVYHNGLHHHVDCWEISTKRYLSEEDAKDLQAITLFKYHYKNRSKIWKLFLPDVREGFRFL